MGKRGPKPRSGDRENNGRLSRSVAAVHNRAEVPFVGWFVYFATAGGFTKVGHSGDLKRRLMQLGTEVRASVRLMGAIRAETQIEALAIEREVQGNLKRKGFLYRGEWFDMTAQDVTKELGSHRGLNRSVLGLDALEPIVMGQVHFHSDATGRKFII